MSNSEDFGLAEFWQCDTEIDTRYFLVTDDHYRITFAFQNEQLGQMDLALMSNESQFNQGTLTFTSDQYTDLNATSGVCASNSDIYTEITNLDSGEEIPPSRIGVITLAVPYESGRLALEMSFGDSVTPGTYTVGSHENLNTVNASAILTSVEFGGTTDTPFYVAATAGSVTIDSVGEFSAAGSFNLSTETGDNLSGSFTFDIE